jgi:glycosyl transferase, family 25
MQVFLINLARSSERLAFMRAQLKDGFERIEAVDGTAVPERLAPQFPSSASMTPGEIGCYASHLLAAEQIVSRGLPYALIMEDDVEVLPDFFENAERAVAVCPPGWDEISLCGARLGRGLNREIGSIGSRKVVKFLRPPKGLGGYILSYNGAVKLLRPRDRIRPIDVDIHYSCGMHFESYGVVPPPSRQVEELPSTIGKRKHRRHWAVGPYEYLIGRAVQFHKFGVWQFFATVLAGKNDFDLGRGQGAPAEKLISTGH